MLVLLAACVLALGGRHLLAADPDEPVPLTRNAQPHILLPGFPRGHLEELPEYKGVGGAAMVVVYGAQPLLAAMGAPEAFQAAGGDAVWGPTLSEPYPRDPPCEMVPLYDVEPDDGPGRAVMPPLDLAIWSACTQYRASQPSALYQAFSGGILRFDGGPRTPVQVRVVDVVDQVLRGPDAADLYQHYRIAPRAAGLAAQFGWTRGTVRDPHVLERSPVVDRAYRADPDHTRRYGLPRWAGKNAAGADVVLFQRAVFVATGATVRIDAAGRIALDYQLIPRDALGLAVH